MPSRGYRKGISDAKTPATRFLRTRITERMHAIHAQEADARGLTHSKLLYALLKSHQGNTRLDVPQPRSVPDAYMRQLANALNNLNQLARQVNTGIVPVTATELRATMRAVEDIARAVRG